MLVKSWLCVGHLQFKKSMFLVYNFGVSLVNGNGNPYEGKLVVEYERQKGTICNDDTSFGLAGAMVVCTMLGYP